MGRVLAPGGIAIVSTNSQADKRELEHLWRQAAGDVLGIQEGPARVQLSVRFTLEDAPAVLGTVFGEIRAIPNASTTEPACRLPGTRTSSARYVRPVAGRDDQAAEEPDSWLSGAGAESDGFAFAVSGRL